MKKYLILIISVLIFTFSYSFEIDIKGLDYLGIEETETKENNKEEALVFNKEAIVFSGDFSYELSAISNEKTTMNYILKDSNNLILEKAYQNKLELNLNANYKYNKFEFVLNTFSDYIDSNNNSFNFYEGFMTYSPNYIFSIQAGKISNYWGKGYSYNPVGFINPEKDSENPEESSTGKNQLNLEFSKALPIKNISAFTGNIVFLFDEEDSTNGFLDPNDLGIALKSYFLVMNSDLDFIYYNKNKNNKIGFDLSTNILEELEFHLEFAKSFNNNTIKVDDAGNLEMIENNTNSYLLGIKWVLPTETNLTVEYYYNEKGIEKDEYNDIYDNYTTDLNKYFNIYKVIGKNPMKKYLYVKLSHSEPFKILYTNISTSTIFNIGDDSLSLKFNINYEPYNNFNCYLESNVKYGKESTEFGDKESKDIKIGAKLSF